MLPALPQRHRRCRRGRKPLHCLATHCQSNERIAVVVVVVEAGVVFVSAIVQHPPRADEATQTRKTEKAAPKALTRKSFHPRRTNLPSPPPRLAHLSMTLTQKPFLPRRTNEPWPPLAPSSMTLSRKSFHPRPRLTPLRRRPRLSGRGSGYPRPSSESSNATCWTLKLRRF